MDVCLKIVEVCEQKNGEISSRALYSCVAIKIKLDCIVMLYVKIKSKSKRTIDKQGKGISSILYKKSHTEL